MGHYTKYRHKIGQIGHLRFGNPYTVFVPLAFEFGQVSIFFGLIMSFSPCNTHQQEEFCQPEEQKLTN
jgi:hypothetical protein